MGVSILLTGMVFDIYTVHAVFDALFLVFAIPVVMTIVYGNHALTAVISVICVAAKAAADLFIRRSANGYNVFSTRERAANFVISLGLLCVFYGVCAFLIMVEREKNNVGILLERERQRFLEEAMTDGLTRVGNRQALRVAFQTMEDSSGGDQRHFLAMLDLDDFKKLNDTCGHNQGDRYLRMLGQTLQSISGEQVAAFRFGGDEFCVLFSGCFPEDVLRTSRLLQQQGQENLAPVTISIGIAEYRAGERPAHLLDRADVALYRAKQNKGSVCFEGNT